MRPVLVLTQTCKVIYNQECNADILLFLMQYTCCASSVCVFFSFRWSVLRFVTWITLLVRVSLQVSTCVFIQCRQCMHVEFILVSISSRYSTVYSGRKFKFSKA